MTQPNRSVTERGFTDYDDFTDTYGAEVTVRQSSAAGRDCVWVFTDGGDVEPRDGSRRNKGSAHLDMEGAKRLRDALDAFVTEHSSDGDAHAAQHETPPGEAAIRADERARIRSLLPYHIPCCENFLASVGDLVNEHGDAP